MHGRFFLVFLVLGGAYAWQHEKDIKRWWRQQAAASGMAAPVTASSSGIKLYTANGCGPCEAAVDLLQAAGVQVAVLNIDEDEAAKAEFEDVGGSLPLILDGGRQTQGFDQEFLTQWYVERSRNRAQLDRVGAYRAGEARLPILYGTAWCGYCAAERKYFADKGIAYRDLDIEHDAEAKRQYDALGLSGVPVTVYEDMIWSGFSAASLDAKRQWVGDVR